MNEEEQAKVAVEKEQEELNKIMELLNVEEMTRGDPKNRERSKADKMSSNLMSPIVRSHAKKMEQQGDNTTGAKRSKKLKYEVLREDWGSEKQNEPPPSTQNITPLPPPPTQSNILSTAHYTHPTPSMVPDDTLLSNGRYAQGFPPVQVDPRMVHLLAGHLGDVTLRGGTVTSHTHTLPPPHPNGPTSRDWSQGGREVLLGDHP